MALYKFNVDGIDCAGCAKELEGEIGKLPGVSNCTIDFGIHSHLSYEYDGNEDAQIEQQMRKIIEEDQKNPTITKVKDVQTASYKYWIKNIDCANCANKLAEKTKAIAGVIHAQADFMQQTILFECNPQDRARIAQEMTAMIAKEEPEVEVSEYQNGDTKSYKYWIKNIDCANCANKLAEKTKAIAGVTYAQADFMQQTILFECNPQDRARIAQEMTAMIAQEEPEVEVSEYQTVQTKSYKYWIKNIDCANCANKLAEKTKAIAGVIHAQADFMQQTILFECNPQDRSRIAQEMTAMIAKEEPEVEVSEYVEEKKKDADEEGGPSMIIRIIIGAILLIGSLWLTGMVQTVVLYVAYIILGYDVLLKAIKNIGKGQLFDEHFLMAVATLAALYLQDVKEAVGVMLFYQIGEYFQDLAVEKSRKNIGDLMDIRPDFAMVKRNGDYESVEPDEVAIDEIVRVKPGERIPLDGVIVSGSSSLDTASLTGESKPRDVDVNDEVFSGSVNQTGVLEIRVTKLYGESTVSKILKLVENSDNSKANQEKFITKFSHYYTPIVVFAAIAVSIVVSIMYGDINVGIERACTFLVISCPCALVISIPLSFFAGIGGLSSRGVLVKGANVIDTLAKVDQVVMDKTGTLTSGEFAVEEVLHSGNKEELLKYAAAAEHFSNHPIALGVQKAYAGTFTDDQVTDVNEIAGRGLSVRFEGKTVLAGNYKLMKENNVVCDEETAKGTLVYVSVDGKYEGCLVLRDQLKQDSLQAIQELHKDGRKCIIVSGDNQEITESIGQKLGVDQAIGGCLPEDKVKTVEGIMKNGSTAFVGDGVNDAPVIHMADVGFAMGALGSDAAIEAADVVLMDDAPSKISLAITASKRILHIANENIYGAIIIKVATLILGAFGIANMWMAIFADTGVAMLCVLNSMRLLYIARKK